MKRRTLLMGGLAIAATALPTGKRSAALANVISEAQSPNPDRADILVLGGTPGGICAAIAAARMGSTVLLLERTAHIGGLCSNGLGATDISTRGATGGLFREFTTRVHAHYVKTFGAKSPQVQTCSDGYHFEPHVAESVFETMLAETPKITILRDRQFDADPAHIGRSGPKIESVTVTNRKTGAKETYQASVFLDATYEGDLAAACGCAFETRREGKDEYGEPFAGRVYRPWGVGPLGEGSTEEGDDTLQAYNYRVCLTDDPQNQVPIAKPDTYNRDDYASLVGDIERGHLTHFMPPAFLGLKGMDVGVVNPVHLPNRKTDANNHHRSFVSSDLPEENWRYPRESWEWRDKFADRLRDYTLGLLWFCQNDPAMPQPFRDIALKWGLAKDEYGDNGHFPRQMYVREGRRITGTYMFTARDCIAPEDLPYAYDIMAGKGKVKADARPPGHTDSITASHYAIDSHAVRKREPNRVHLDGFLGLGTITRPYQVPFGVMVPRGDSVDNLLTPVPVSASHLGFGTLRMEPCWMAMGHAAGVAAHLSLTGHTPVRAVSLPDLQRHLIEQKQVLLYLSDVPMDHPHFAALQILGTRFALFPGYAARPDEKIDHETAADWAKKVGVAAAEVKEGETRGAYLTRLL